MNTARKTLMQTTALILVCAVSLLTMHVAPALAAPPASTVLQITGQLTTTGNRSIIVNGNSTEAGATILDGATIETPDGTGATVNLGPLGQIDLEPNTIAVINFSDGQIKVTLKRGCAAVRKQEGVVGTIETPDGTTTSADQPDTNNRKKASACVPIPGGASAGATAGTTAGAGGGGGGIAGTTVAVIAGLGAIAAGVIIGLNTDEGGAEGDNQSPSSLSTNQ